MEGKIFVLALALALQLSLCRELGGAEDEQAAKDTEATPERTTTAAEGDGQRAHTKVKIVDYARIVKRAPRNDLDSVKNWVPNFCEPGRKSVDKCNRCWCVKPGIPVCTKLPCETLPKEDWPHPDDF